MPRYKIWFSGRKIGAIGVWSEYVLEIEASSEEAAKLKCYDTHEHISFIEVVEKPE